MYIEIKNPLIYGTDDLIVASQESLEDEYAKYTLIAKDNILKMYNKGEDYSIVLVGRKDSNQSDIAFNFFYGSLNKETNNFIKGTINIGYDGELVSIKRTDVAQNNFKNLIKYKSIKDIDIPQVIKPVVPQKMDPNSTGYPLPYRDSKTGDPLPWKDTLTSDPIPEPYIIVTSENNEDTKSISTSTTIKHINIAKTLEAKSDESVEVDDNMVSIENAGAIVKNNTLDLDQRKKFQTQFMQTMNKKHKEL